MGLKEEANGNEVSPITSREEHDVTTVYHGIVNFDQLMKVIPATFLCCKVTIFPFSYVH